MYPSSRQEHMHRQTQNFAARKILCLPVHMFLRTRLCKFAEKGTAVLSRITQCIYFGY